VYQYSCTCVYTLTLTFHTFCVHAYLKYTSYIHICSSSKLKLLTYFYTLNTSALINQCILYAVTTINKVISIAPTFIDLDIKWFCREKCSKGCLKVYKFEVVCVSVCGHRPPMLTARQTARQTNGYFQ